MIFRMRASFRVLLPLLACAALSSAFAQNGDQANEVQAPPPAHLVIPPAPVLLAEDALKTITVAPGFRVEIAAADPLVGDPVAATFGPDGRLWVVEMRAFMPNPDGKGEDAKVGAVVYLEDTDHDGRYDKRTVFVDGLVLPRALTLVDDGVLVAEPPHLWFFRDKNHDGKVDDKIEVASDYGAPGNPEHTANGLLWALDNWIYSANHNVRYRYLGDGKFQQEFTVMRGQWGISQDDVGRLYHNNNSDPLRYDAVPSAYFTRNPTLTNPSGLNVGVVPANLRIWPLRVTPGVNRGYKSLDATGRITAVTAACAPFIYRGAMTPELRGDAFVCEPSGNLIKRISLATADDRLKGHNSYEGAEFIASTDERFRPVNLASGPDGALYIVDMYRGIIQHRIYLTTYLRKQIEDRGLAEGMGMGRIYRVIPAAGAKAPAAIDLTKESSTQLVAHLKSSDGWWRDTAQRLLVERRDADSAAPLRALAKDSSTLALARLHALWTLDGIGQLERETILAALRDPDIRVQVAAIRLSEKLLAAADREVFDAVLAATAPGARANEYALILQQAFSLSEWPHPEAVAALVSLANRQGDRPYVADAIVSGLRGERLLAFIVRAFAEAPSLSPKLTPAVSLAASSVWRTGDAAQLGKLTDVLASEPARAVLIESLKRIIPKRDDELLFTRLTAAPTALEKIANDGASPLAAQAKELLAHLRWPGNEGPAVVVQPLTPEQQKLFDKGHEVFMGICAGCHQPTGLGLQGLAPALVNSKWVAGNERALARIVLQGKMREGAIMPPLGALDDESLAGALTFVRRSWGHGFAPVSVETIARARAETAGRVEPWTDKDLAKISDENPVREGAN